MYKFKPRPEKLFIEIRKPSDSVSVSVSFPDFSPVTKQEFKNECDINFMMGKYLATGQVPVINQRSPQYLDVSTVPDFAGAMAIVQEATSLFNDLPSALRTRFGHNPQAFLDYVSNPSNIDEMRSLGLLKSQPKIESVPPVEGQNVDPQNSNPA